MWLNKSRKKITAVGFIHISPSFLKGVENLYGMVYLFLLIWVAWQHRAS